MAVDPSVRIDIAAEFVGKKAFDKASKSTSSLEKNVKTLGKSLAGVFAAKKVLAFGKASAMAFADDEKAATRLAVAVKNLGLGFENARISTFIQNLEKTSGVMDDSLRPAFQALLTTTGSVTKSQELLNLAIDVAAGGTEDLATVSEDLAQAYVGNTKGLKKYDLGLTAAELKAAKFSDIQAKITKQFSGANAAYLQTYAGKLAVVNVAYDNMQESIGGALLDSFSLLAGDNGIGGATNAMEAFGTATGNAIYGVASLISKLNSKLSSDKFSLSSFLYNAIPVLPALIDYGAKEKAKNTPLFFPTSGGTAKQNAADDKARKAAEAAALKRAKELEALQKKSLMNEKAKATLNKASAVFDLQKMQIAAALKGKITDEEKTRLLLMQAIEEGNADKAETLAKKLAEIQEKNAKIAKSLTEISNVDNPFQAWVDSLTAASALLGTIGTQSSGSGMPALFKPDGSLTPKGKINIPTGGDLPSFNDVTTPTAIADAVVNVAEEIVAAAAEAIVAEVPNILGGFGASVPGLAEFIASAGITAAETPTNVSASPMGSTGGFGFSLPSYLQNTIPQTPTIIVNNNGSVIMQDEFIDAVNDAVLASIRVGYGRTPAGLIG